MRLIRRHLSRSRRGARDVVFVMLYAGPLLAARAGIGEGSTGGAETQVFLLARELAGRGHRVAIATFELPSGLPPAVEGVEIIALPARPAGASRARQLHWAARLLLALARARGRIVVQRGAGAATGLVALVNRACGRRFVYSSAHVMDFDYDAVEPDPWARRLFAVGRRLAHTIVVQSDEQAQLCRLHWGRGSVVVRSLAEPAPARSAAPEGFLWIGRLAPYKRPEVVLELARRLPQAPFWMIGSGASDHPEVFEPLRAGAARLPNVELLSARARTELAALYDRAVAVVNTSDAEGMSNILLEGWARGVPALVLAHDPDGLVARAGLGWFAEGSVDRLAELAAAAWDGRDAQAQIAERARAYVAREHAPAAVAACWERALGLGDALR